MGNVLAPYKTERHTVHVGKFGAIEGLTLSRPETNEQLVRRYLNVPFVLPPTGLYRWRKPRPLPGNYTYTRPDGSPRDCTIFGRICPQPEYTKLGNHAFSKYDEDCLSLNIWAPAGTPPDGGWPVMLWFHGGWLQVGDPSIDPNTDPTELISQSGGGLQCVFIAAAYRLSVFGFMGSRELADEAQQNGEEGCGNYGLWDQYAALEWVHKYASYFGGNAENLTLSGRSAGAYSVHAIASHDLLMKPSAPTRYKRLVMYSNAIPADPKTLEDVQPQFDELLDACNIPRSLSDTKKLAKLRAIPAFDLVDKVMTLSAHTFRPIRDGCFFPLNLFDRFLAGDFGREFKARQLQLLIGEVRDEETLYRQTNPPHDLETLYIEVGNYYSPPVTRMMVDAYLNRKVHKEGAHPDPDPKIDFWKKIFGDIISDGQVRAPTRLLVRQLVGAGVPLSSIRRYMINWRPSFVDSQAPKELGVSHALDRPIWNFSVMHGPTPKEESTMRAWIRDLVDFVHGQQTDYGTRDVSEHKVLRPDGTIGVEKDTKWDYLVTVADEMCTAK
ncbi:hypothetical protein E1B28_013417 [Marasmius oreades]|uniref:Carboxylic ester hydrolase n=1 Tax=Marasmius oreades TaxID=181124 RepID=A0A9P7UP03_9AGAR|nr:uncharacterized protein E1B28_013417 [Marasmius oreades]KAG7087451.1 hypothetical protein E1B28_013417 [Marasmius oreades]